MSRRGVVGLVGLVGLVMACATPRSHTCADGRVCASNAVCDDANHRCITDEQADACAAIADGGSCMLGASFGECVSGACLIPVCGDGVRTGLEICEGDDLGGTTCAELGYYQETTGLACKSDCSFDELTGCDQWCGDGIINGPEECDGPDALGGDCTNAGYYEAPGLGCTSHCTWNVVDCHGKCGDGMVEGAEVCDGSPPQNGCLYYAFDYGAIGCALCGPEFSHCGTIGWRYDVFAPPQGVQALSGRTTNDVWAAGSNFVAHRTNETWSIVDTTINFGTSLALRGTNEVFVGGSMQVSGSSRPHVRYFNGSTWTTVALPSPNTGAEAVTSLATASNGDVYAGTTLGIYRYDGTTWTRLTTGAQMSAVSGLSPTDVWVVGNSSVRHWNGSALAINTPSGCASFSVTDVYAADATHVFATCNGGVAMWNGSTWSMHATPGKTMYALFGTSATDVVATGPDGTVLAYDGTRWRDLSTGGTETLTAVWGAAGTLFASAGIQVTVMRGSTWQPPPVTSLNTEVFGLWASGDTAFVTTNDGVYQRQVDGSWLLNASATYLGEAVWGFGASDVYVADVSNQLWHWNGVDWQSSPTPAAGVTKSGATYKSQYAIWGTSGSDLFLGSSVGTTTVTVPVIEHWNGVAWTTVYTSSQTNVGMNEINGSGPNDVWVALGTGTLLRWNGSVWSEVTVPGATAISAVWSFSPTHAVAVGDGIHVWNGSTWTEQDAPVTRELTDIWARSTTDIFAVGRAGLLVHYDGMVWSPVRDPRDTSASVVAAFGSATHVFLLREDTANTDVLYQSAPWQ